MEEIPKDASPPEPIFHEPKIHEIEYKAASESAEEEAWYYVINLQKNRGPVTKTVLREMFKNGIVYANTMVWHKSFGKEWRQLRETDLCFSESLPPPLPPQRLRNGAAWAMVGAPIIAIVIAIVISIFLISTGAAMRADHRITSVSYLILVITAFVIDRDAVMKYGSPPLSKSFLIAIILLPIVAVPYYFWDRTKKTGQSKIMFWTSICAFSPFVYGLYLSYSK